MYTQCPDCESAFRVTARMLQQAAGQVHCGDCGHAFNALERLSEDPPAADGSHSGERENKALLDSLDEFSGPDNVRIEDTGVEWRVLDEALYADAVGAVDSESDDSGSDPDDTASVRWYMEVDPPDRNAQAALDFPQPSGDSDEERYDDNTPLPDDLDEAEQNAPPETPRRRAEDRIEPRSPEFDERQVDLALSDAADWTDLLDEVGSEMDARTAAATEDELADTDIRDLGGEVFDEPPGEGDLPSDVAATGSIDPTGEQPVAEAGPENEHENDHASGSEPAHYVPPQTTEEMTIDRLIDQDLLRLTEEERALGETTPGDRVLRNEPALFETIIMEGEYVHRALDNEPPSVDIEAAAGPNGDTAGFKDIQVTSAERPHDGAQKMATRDRAIVAATAVLALLMVAQVVHAYRASLATHDAFKQTVGSIYRFFGAPVTPDWSVKGWQVEWANGHMDTSDRVLTISSRIGNKSDQSLPYPLLHVSLVDRWQEIIGSRVLEPDEYLPDDVEQDRKILPDEKLTAVITISPLSPDADGFKLNVCYRASGKQLRCANSAFKN